MQTLRIASRRSPLALAQSALVANLLRRARPGLAVEIVPMDTRGDLTPGSLVEVGGKGLFTAELEAAMRRGEVDLAVHSAKDLPAEMPGDMLIAACPPREDPRDVLLTLDGADLAGLPPAARVGTSSLRRAGQVRHARPDARIEPVRGNLETRMRRVFEGRLDAVVLAMAGLRRGGHTERLEAHLYPLEPAGFVPAAGQGTLAVQTLTEAVTVREMLAGIDDADAHAALDAERSIVRALGAGCTSPVGAWVARAAGGWAGRAVVGRPADPADLLRAETQGAPSAAAAAEALLASLRERGAREWLGAR